MTLDLPPQAGAARDDAIVARVVGGAYDALTWQAVTSEVPGHTGTFYVMADALKLDGVRVNVSAYALQEVADALGCLLLTPKLCDLMWLQRKATLLPQLTPIAADTATMIRMSAVVDAALAALDNVFVGLVQKTWCLDNDLLAHGGKAENYGFFVQPDSGTSWRGIGTEACVYAPSPANRVIQGRGWAHDIRHADYSQLCQALHRGCVVDGNNMDAADVLRDSTLAPLLSHQGALRLLRQPGVPLSRCPVRAVGNAGVGVVFAGDTVCPLQGLRPPTQGHGWKTYALAAGIVGAGGYVAWRIYKKRRRSR